jgi:hypothetical protein
VIDCIVCTVVVTVNFMSKSDFVAGEVCHL